MVTKNTSPKALSKSECRTLVAILNEQYGPGLMYDEFLDGMLGLFEDIPGFEAMSPEEAAAHLQTLWSLYHGQKI